jgi:hypothetical protein
MSIFDDIDVDPREFAGKATKVEPKMFPCISCAGTGKFLFRNGNIGDCFACQGSGKRKATAAEQRNRKEGARKAKITREQNIRNGIMAFQEEHGELHKWLSKNSDWNTFAASLLDQLTERGKLSDKQIAAAERMVAKTEEKRAEKRKANEKDVGDVEAIKEMFDRALENGLKRRALVAAKLIRDENGVPVLDEDGKAQLDGDNTIKMTPARAPRTEIWVKLNGEFMGGIKDGKFSGRNAPEWLAKELALIAANPSDEARFFGQATGTCCMCSRELTNKASIDAGIGPICASKWLGG